MAVVKVIDSGGFSKDLFSGFFEGALLNNRSSIVFHDKGNDSFVASVLVNKTYRVLFDADGTDISITPNALTGTLNTQGAELTLIQPAPSRRWVATRLETMLDSD